MAPAAAPDMIIPGVEDVVADAARHSKDPAGDQTMVLNMGPQHPSTHGVLRLVLEIDGETVVSLAPDIGYLHTGIEKTCEAKFYQQVVPLTDRIDYLSPMTNNLAYCLAVEKLLATRDPGARRDHPHPAERTHAHPVAPGVAGHARHGHRRAHRLPVLLPRARRASAAV